MLELVYIFYQEALHKFLFLSHVDSLVTIRDRHWQKLVATFQKPNQQIYAATGAFACGVPIFVWVLINCDCDQNGYLLP